jgi:hypothetical protein
VVSEAVIHYFADGVETSFYFIGTSRGKRCNYRKSILVTITANNQSTMEEYVSRSLSVCD